MQAPFILSCESTIDLPYHYAEERHLPVLFYTYTLNGQEYEDDMGRDPEALPRFYRLLSEGHMPSTSQVNVFRYVDFFESLLQQGDVLHIAFGSGMTPSVRNAQQAAEQLRSRYPDRRLVVVDSLCSCSGYGLLVDALADLRDEGKSMEELEQWALAHRNQVHHQFFSTDIRYFRRSGRVSGATAMVATVLGICPIMHLNNEGRIISYSKTRGKRNAIEETVREMERHAVGGRDYSGKCFISHSNCPEEAEQTAALIRERFPHIAEVRITEIGTIIASHCGPGTVAVYFFGDERQA